MCTHGVIVLAKVLLDLGVPDAPGGTLSIRMDMPAEGFRVR